jgi:hypothetical protein
MRRRLGFVGTDGPKLIVVRLLEAVQKVWLPAGSGLTGVVPAA